MTSQQQSVPAQDLCDLGETIQVLRERLARAEAVIAAERRALNIAYAELKRNERIGGFKKVTREVLDNIRVFVPDIDERNDELAAYRKGEPSLPTTGDPDGR